MGFLVQSPLGHKSMALTCYYPSPWSDGHAYAQVTDARVRVPLGHESFGHDAIPPALSLIGPGAPIADSARHGHLSRQPVEVALIVLL
jgi:hypothetical protein